MKMLLPGAVGVLALQVLLVGGYFAVNSQGPSSCILIANWLKAMSLWPCFAGTVAAVERWIRFPQAKI